MERRNARRQNSPVFSFGFAPRESTSPKTPEKPADSGKSKNPPEFREGSETPSKPRGSDPRGSRSLFSIPRPRSFKRSDMQSDTHPASAQSDTRSDIHADLHHSPRSDTRSDAHPDPNQHQNQPSNAHPDTHPDAHSAYWLPRSRLGQSEPPSGSATGTGTASEAPSGYSSGRPSSGPSSGPSVHAGSSGSSGSSGYRNPFYCYFERQRSFRPRRPALGRRGGER